MNLFILFFLLIIIANHLFYWKNKQKPVNSIGNVEYHAHRGVQIGCPENTLQSYLSAVQNDFDWIELDIITSKDGVIVCSHNFDLECETNGVGYIHKLNYSMFKSIYTGTYLNKKSKNKIPTLSEVFKACGDKIGYNIEVKFSHPFDLKTARALGAYLRTIKNKRIMVSSFNPFVILYFRIFYRPIKTAFLFENLELYWVVNIIHPTYIHPRIDVLNDKIIKHAKNHNLGINVWTANNYPVIEHLKRLDIDGIITDVIPKHD